MSKDQPVHFIGTDDGVRVTQGGVTIVVPPHLIAALIREAAKSLP